MGARNRSLKGAMGIGRFYKHRFDLVERKTQVRPGGRGCSRVNASLTGNSRESEIQKVFLCLTFVFPVFLPAEVTKHVFHSMLGNKNMGSGNIMSHG